MIQLLPPPHKAGFEDSSTILGSGGNAVVYSFTYESNTVAIKVPRIGSEKSIQRELVAFKRLCGHQNVVRLLGTFKAGEGFGLILDRYDCDLFAEVYRGGPFTNERAAPVAWQIATALQFVHSNGLVLVDLKLDNILIKRSNGDEHVAIADLGLVHTNGAKIDAFVGTGSYMPPEAMKAGIVSIERDMWSFGVCIFGLVSGLGVYDRGAWRETRNAILNDPVPVASLPCSVLTDARQLIVSLLQKIPSTDRMLTSGIRLFCIVWFSQGLTI